MLRWLFRHPDEERVTNFLFGRINMSANGTETMDHHRLIPRLAFGCVTLALRLGSHFNEGHRLPTLSH
jgi:hypothetical protein